jgi:DNA-directed RNA polymerase subunit F
MLMSTVEMRDKVHQMIDEVDPALLEAIHAMLETYQKRQEGDPVVSYDVVTGTPRSASELTAILEEEVAAVRRGEFTTFEDFQKESAQWNQRTK